MSWTRSLRSSPASPEPREPLKTVEVNVSVRVSSEVLFEGNAQLDLTDEAQWTLEFTVPAARVAQFQMRRGERLYIDLPGESANRSALVQGCRLEDDAGFSGFSGSGAVLLTGEGPPPRKR